MKVRRRAAILFLLLLLVVPTLNSYATTVVLQDYENGPSGPWTLHANFSGSSEGFLSGDTWAVVSGGAAGTSFSAEISLSNDPSNNNTSGGWAWQARLLPNNAGASGPDNPVFDADGFVGYYLQVDPSVTADLYTAPIFEAANTLDATAGMLKSVVKDGAWHLYEWNLDDPAQFPNTFGDVFGGGIGDTTIETQVSYDSIAVVSTTPDDAAFRIDEIRYNNAGSVANPPPPSRSPFTKLHDFSEISIGGIAISDDKLYGTTVAGGAADNGTIWEYDPNAEVYTQLHEFTDNRNGTDPEGGVVLSGSTIYGTARFGGARFVGTIWSFDMETNTLRKLHDFSSATDGARPEGGIDRQGDIIYGTAKNGGALDSGTLWSFDTSANTFTNLRDFDGASDGSAPGNPVTIEGARVRGTSSNTLWEYEIGSDEFTTLHPFDGFDDGASPESNVVQLGTMLFGTASRGLLFPETSAGTLWSYDTASGVFEVIHAFDAAADGEMPEGNLAVLGTTLYGTTREGGDSDGGTLWAFDTATSTFEKLHDFAPGFDGFDPSGGVSILGSTLYGTTRSGGGLGKGTLWSYVIPEPASGSLTLLTLACCFVARRRPCTTSALVVDRTQ